MRIIDVSIAKTNCLYGRKDKKADFFVKLPQNK
jgi:hypothetical protein